MSVTNVKHYQVAVNESLVLFQISYRQEKIEPSYI